MYQETKTLTLVMQTHHVLVLHMCCFPIKRWHPLTPPIVPHQPTYSDTQESLCTVQCVVWCVKVCNLQRLPKFEIRSMQQHLFTQKVFSTLTKQPWRQCSLFTGMWPSHPQETHNFCYLENTRISASVQNRLGMIGKCFNFVAKDRQKAQPVHRCFPK